MLIKRLFPFLNWPKLTLALAKSEAFAGLTVAWVIIPQAIAYAMLAGMPPMTGIYMALVPAFVAVAWGACVGLATGPAALTCVLVGASVLGLELGYPPFSEQWVAMGVWLALLSGLMQLGLGAFKLGWFISLVSNPVMMGFTQAAACLIIASQLSGLFGVPRLSMVLQPEVWNLWALLIGSASLGVLLMSKLWSKKIPWILVVIALSALLSAYFDFSAHTAVVGVLPISLPSLALPSWLDWGQFQALLLPAAVIALVSFLECASSAKIEHQRFGTRWDDNQELIGQGLAKCAAALLGASPSSASFSRSALNLYAGARTGWATVFMVLFAMALLVLGASALSIVPKAVLAAVVIAAVSNLLISKSFFTLWQTAKAESIIAMITFFATLFSAPHIYWGVLTGVSLSLGHFLYQRLHPRMIEVGLHGDGSLRDRHLWQLPALGQQVFAVRMDAALDFASAASFERQLYAGLAGREAVSHVCIFAQPINWIDATGIETLVNLQAALQSKQITLHLSGLKLPLEQAFKRASVLQAGPYLHLYRNEAETLSALKTL